MSLTEHVARFICGMQPDRIPADVMHLGKRSILDGIGLALAGNVAGSGRIVGRYLRRQGLIGSSGSTIIGSDMRAAPRFAAFANGIAIHADDYDDTQLAVAPDRVYGLLTHPTAPALPPVLALAEHGGASGLDVLAAYHVAVEVETKLAEAIDSRHYDDGFHSTATMGTIGAAAGAARMLGLDVEQTRCAIGVAASQAAGLRENFGTMTKSFHAGRACESGIVAADLARLGWTAAGDVLEAERGFFRAAGGGWDSDAIEGRLGQPWTFEFPGVSIKPHPSGSLTHPAMGLLLDLIRTHTIAAADVECVRVGTNRHSPNALIHHTPRTGMEAKFSMEFCLAILLLDGKAGLDEFADSVVNRDDVQRMIERVELGVHPDAEASGYARMTTLIEIQLRDGRTISGRADFARGSPANPMSDGELQSKFRECADRGGLTPLVAASVIEMVFELEQLATIHPLMRLLAP